MARWRYGLPSSFSLSTNEVLAVLDASWRLPLPTEGERLIGMVNQAVVPWPGVLLTPMVPP